jgi:hypothetical protein
MLLLGFGPWQEPDRAIHADSQRYLLLAKNLREFHTFGLRGPGGLMHQSVVRLRAGNGTLPDADANGLRPESFRTPGYPAFIALVESFGGGIQTLLLIQCLLGAVSASLAAFIGQSLGLSRRGALLVGLLWALHPGLIVFDCALLTESLFDAVAVAGLFLACRARPPWGLLTVGFVLGVATLVRPLGYLYIPAALALAWPQVQSKIVAIAFLLLACGLPLSAWAARNQTVEEGFRLTTVGDLNLLYYTDAYAISEQRGEDWLQTWPTRVEGLTNRLSGQLQPGEDVVVAVRRFAWREIQMRPRSVAKVQGKSWIKLYIDHSLDTTAATLGLPYQPSGLFSSFVLGHDTTPASQPGNDQSPKRDQGSSLAIRAGALTWMGLNALLALAALGGANRAVHQRQWRILIFGALTILLFTLATCSVGLERFRLPMMLPLFVLAAHAISALQSKSTTKEPDTIRSKMPLAV